MEYHVAKHGNDGWQGTVSAPFATISRAAELAKPGDTVTVHAGVYREWVSPAFGGRPDAPIVYQAAGDGETVISGAEPVRDWERLEGNTWVTRVDNRLFTIRNPFREHLAGDWLFPGALESHLGDVYLNGKSLYEMPALEQVIQPAPWPDARYPQDSLLTWYAETDETATTIYANFGGRDPREERVEISVRPWCFWPEEEGRDFITVRGFTLCQACPQWAPPTALQEGLIGPNWSWGWVIEDNLIFESKSVGVSLGKRFEPVETQEQYHRTKGGTQREQEAIFRAVRDGWRPGKIGGHTVRRNVIHDCEQAGIAGHLGGAFSEISGNRIYNIHHKMLYHGAEVAGIKLHGALDTRIENNLIYSCYRGIWLDWQAQGTRISKNVLFDNPSEDLFVEVCHGPYLVDHNVLASGMNFRDMSQGGSFVHNLFAGKIVQRPELTRWTPYHFPHDTPVAGYSNITGGDHRFYNNLFLGDEAPLPQAVPMTFFEHLPLPPREKPESSGPAMDGVPDDSVCWLHSVGLGAYDAHPDGAKLPNRPMTEAEMRMFFEAYGAPGVHPLPNWFGGNAYLGGAVPCAHETEPMTAAGSGLQLIAKPGEGMLELRVLDAGLMASLRSAPVSSEQLGRSRHADMGWVSPDGSAADLITDLIGMQPGGDTVTPGPIQIENVFGPGFWIFV